MFSKDSIEKEIFEFIKNSEKKITFSDLKKHFKKSFSTSDIKGAVNYLVKSNSLTYTSKFGNSYLEISYDKPVRVGDRFVLTPSNQNLKKENPDDIVIKLEKGASFGTGAHPTTRLCLKGVEKVFETVKSFDSALDIGTGSGVLAIAAAKMGAKKVYATDIHEVAVSEAKRNVSLNNLEEIIEVSLKNPDETGKVSLIMANLRFPTLKELYNDFVNISEEDCYMVISGIREDEADNIILSYKKHRLIKRWDDSNWSGLVMKLV